MSGEDPCDILEDDGSDDGSPVQSPSGQQMMEAARGGHEPEDQDGAGELLGGVEGLPEAVDPGDIKAALGGMTAELANSLQSITEEMNRIKSELYGDQGIGGIAKEIEKLKTGGLGQLLKDQEGLDGLLGSAGGAGSGLGGLGALGGAGLGGGSHSGGDRPASRLPRDISGAGGRGAGAGAAAKARPDKSSFDREAELERLKQKLQAQRRQEAQKKQDTAAVSMGEKGLLFFLVLVCLYIGSPLIRTSVNKAVGMVLFGENFEDDEF